MERILSMSACVGLAVAVTASEFRRIRRIAVPERVAAGQTTVAEPEAVPRALVKQAVERVVAAWNTQGLRKVLAPSFFDRSRLQDRMDTDVPRDATLRVLSIHGAQTLAQRVTENAQGRALRISTVSATVRTQIEFNDPRDGFRRIPGTNELILEITHSGG